MNWNKTALSRAENFIADTWITSRTVAFSFRLFYWHFAQVWAHGPRALRRFMHEGPWDGHLRGGWVLATVSG